MDSRKEVIEALEEAKRRAESIHGYSAIDKINEALALLTAEPEPCEDANAAFDTMHMLCVAGEPDAARAEFDRYFSQVADKRAEELRDVVIETARFLKARQDKSDGELYIISKLEQSIAATEPKP